MSESENPRPSRRDLPAIAWWAWASAGVVALVLVAGLVYVASGAVANVPNLVGVSEDAARARLAAAGLSLGKVSTVETAAAAGTVVAQDPRAGTIAGRGQAVALTVAAARQGRAPDVTGRTLDEARTLMAAAGFDSATLDTNDASAPVDTVLAQAPGPGELLPRGAVVGLLVSRGPVPGTAKVPDVTGKAELDALAVLKFAGFVPSVVDSPGSTLPTDSAAGQFPPPGTRAALNSTVDVLVSRGGSTDATTVPSLLGLPQADAVATLSAGGFPSRVLAWRGSSAPTGSVIAQLPAAGAHARRGSDVLVVISAGSAPASALPGIEGLTLEAARATLAPLGVVLDTAASPSGSDPADTVIAQLPPAGSQAAPGSHVLAIVSSGPPR